MILKINHGTNETVAPLSKRPTHYLVKLKTIIGSKSFEPLCSQWYKIPMFSNIM